MLSPKGPTITTSSLNESAMVLLPHHWTSRTRCRQCRLAGLGGVCVDRAERIVNGARILICFASADVELAEATRKVGADDPQDQVGGHEASSLPFGDGRTAWNGPRDRRMS